MQALIQQPGFEGVRVIVLGKYQRASSMDPETLAEIVSTKPELDGVPVVANARFGHTPPGFTFPIGGTGALVARAGDVELRIEKH